LGTVPVEDDGSAYFLAPIEREIYFQALDEKSMAVQSMRSGTYVHPGEHLTCLGCHEDKWEAPTIPQTPKAFRRAPSPITPDPSGSCPLNYYSLVKAPVFDKKCLPCHQREKKGLQTFDYWVENTKKLEEFRRVRPFVSGPIEEFLGYYAASWNRDDWFGPGKKDYRYFGSLGYRSTAGKVGARMCPLTSKLDPTHHNVQLTADERYRATLWMDLNSMERGDYNPSSEAKIELRKGKAIWPLMDMDSTNPTGIQIDGTIPGEPLEE
jgi:hypothetical protein